MTRPFGIKNKQRGEIQEVARLTIVLPKWLRDDFAAICYASQRPMGEIGEGLIADYVEKMKQPNHSPSQETTPSAA